MALLEIKKAGDPVLKEVCTPVARVDNKLKKLLDNMAETMYEADGVGLAAPQVGVPIRAVVIDTGDGLFDMVNPVIVKKEGSELGTEGCLSVPQVYGEVERATQVTVEFTNRKNKRQRITVTGLFARCVQHELDHLEGQLFIDVAKTLRHKEAEE